MPPLEQLQSELAGKVKAVKMNAVESSDIAAQYRVMAVPTVILFHQGQAAARWVGPTPKDPIRNKLLELKV